MLITLLGQLFRRLAQQHVADLDTVFPPALTID
jgi:hypothetical protein